MALRIRGWYAKLTVLRLMEVSYNTRKLLKPYDIPVLD